MRACNYVHVIITDGVVLREVNKVRQKMFHLIEEFVRDSNQGKGAEFPINQCRGM